MEMLMKNPYIASSIANYFISNKNLDVDNLKLNKLVYISYGFALACFKEELELFKEPIQAWRLGPVIPSIYHEFKRYGYNSTKKKYLILKTSPTSYLTCSTYHSTSPLG